MAIALTNCLVKQQNQSFLAKWTNWTLSSHDLLWLLDNIAWSSVHHWLFFTVPLRPLVGLRPPSKISSFFHSTSLFLLYFSLFCQEHNSKMRSLSMLVLSHSDTHTLAQWVCGILRVPRKEWPVPQLTRIYGMVRVTQNRDSAFFQCSVLDSSLLINFLFVYSLGRCVANWSIPSQDGNLFGKLNWIILLSMI